MPTPSPHLARAYELLADGEWHDREAIMREMAKVITPGAAVRFGEQMRQISGLGTSPPVRRIPRSTEFLIASGKRAMCRAALRNQRVLHRVEGDGRTVVRLAPPRLAPGSREARLARGEKVRALPVPLEQGPPVTYRSISAHLRRAFELLADGEWHNRDAVLEAMVMVVDPDIAVAVAERRQREASARRLTDERRRSRNDRPYLIAAGSRAVAGSALQSAKRIEHRSIDGTDMLRLRAPRYRQAPPS